MRPGPTAVRGPPRAERIEVDVDQLGGVLGDGPGGGDDRGQRFADVAHGVVGQQAPRQGLGGGIGSMWVMGRAPAAARSAWVTTATTPGRRRALVVEMARIRAWATGLRTNATWHRPGTSWSAR